MKKTVFTGAGVAIVTPMFEDGSVNYDVLGQLIEYQIENGTDAIISCGTTGESATLDNQEHCDVLSYTIKKVNGRVPVVAGTGSNDTRYAVELSRHAQEAGSDALLMVTPYYNKTSQTGLINHYHYVADRVDVPIILYNVPSRTGCNIQPTTYVELAKHPNIVATKEASGDISSIAKTISLCGDDLAVYSGNDDQVIPILSLGGKGVISVFSNIYPQKMHQICAEFFNGNTEKSRDMMLHYLDLMNGLFCDVNPIPVKEAMNMMGYQCGPCRMPLAPMSESAKVSLAALLKKHGLI